MVIAGIKIGPILFIEIIKFYYVTYRLLLIEILACLCNQFISKSNIQQSTKTQMEQSDSEIQAQQVLQNSQDSEQEGNLGRLMPSSEEEFEREKNHNNSNQRHKKLDFLAHSKPFQQSQIVSKQIKQIFVHKEAKPRLIIDKILVENFKSYAGKQVIGPFHQNFTCVIGPNGSGKSNLIETLLFIFGFNARWMRSTRLNKLIHNSANAKNCSKASVAVHFKKVIDMEDGSVSHIQNSQISVQRTISSNNVSKYYLNGRQSTNEEVKAKLNEQGIDLQNNRFLIMQGEVEHISQMKPKSGDPEKPGLLEYLQDIIGSNKFIEQIDECTKKYDQINEVRVGKANLVKSDQKDLKGLLKPKEQAIKFVKIQRTIFQIKNILNQCAIKEASLKVQQNKEKLIQFQQMLTRVKNQEREKMTKHSQRIKEMKRNKEELTNCDKQIKEIDEQIRNFGNKDTAVQQDIRFKSEDVVKLARKFQELQKNREKIIQQSKQIHEKLPSVEKELSQLGEQVDRLKSQLSKHNNPQLNQRIKQIQSQLKRRELEKQAMKEKTEAINRKLAKMEENEVDYSAKIKQNQNGINQNQMILKDLKSAIGQATSMRKSILEQITKCSNQKRLYRENLQKLEMQINITERENHDTRMMENLFTKIMEKKINGVIGRLGDLGRTNPMYDQIITTANGPKLDSIVVRTYEAAKQVVNFLKSQRLGRVSCIILDKIEQYSRYMKKDFQKMEDAERLFDQIQFSSQEAKVAFYFVLQDTLYCKNSQLGLKYAMGEERVRRRVISKTKKGGYVIYQPNGLMMSTQTRRGGFQNKGTRATNVNRQIRDQNKQYIEEKHRLQNVLRQIEKIYMQKDSELRTIDKDIMKMQKQKKDYERKVLDLDDQLREARQKIERQDSNKKKAAMNKENFKKELEAIATRVGEIQRQQAKIEQKLESLIEQRKQKEGSKISGLREEHKEKKAKYLHLQKEYNRNVTFLGQTQQRLLQNKQEQSSVKNKIEKLQEIIKKLRNESLVLEEKGLQIMQNRNRIEARIQQCKDNEMKLKHLSEEEQNMVKESKRRVEKARADMQLCDEKVRQEQLAMQHRIRDLEKVREDYQHLLKNYDFMESIQEIQKMQILKQQTISGSILELYEPLNNSILNTSVLNVSQLDTSQIINSSVENLGSSFPAQKMLATMPFQDLGRDIQSFLIHQEKMRIVLSRQEKALEKFTDVNLSVIKEFKKKYLSYKQKYEEYAKLKQTMSELKTKIDEMKYARLTMFREGFTLIASKLKETYQMLTRGGDADLQLIDSLDPFSDGINFSVRPPKKSWKEINKLSGGQKTLSSLSLIFALHYFKPTPLYFMDEIDAALDFRNVSIVAQYIKRRTKNAQFIIISLRNHLFDMADKLVGVYKQQNMTRTLLLCSQKFLANVKQRNQKGKENDNGNLKADV